jgi:hypothetical protein
MVVAMEILIHAWWPDRLLTPPGFGGSFMSHRCGWFCAEDGRFISFQRLRFQTKRRMLP